jgi:hypothetical protein
MSPELREKLDAALDKLDSVTDEIRSIVSLADGKKPMKHVVQETPVGFQTISTNPDVAEKIAKRICLNCGKKIDPKLRPVRGNHPYCARKIKDSIDSGDITEEAAIAAGIYLPEATRGPKTKKKTGLAQLLEQQKTQAEIESVKASQTEAMKVLEERRSKKRD